MSKIIKYNWTCNGEAGSTYSSGMAECGPGSKERDLRMVADCAQLALCNSCKHHSWISAESGPYTHCVLPIPILYAAILLLYAYPIVDLMLGWKAINTYK